MLLKLSNHPYYQWGENQKETGAKSFSETVGLAFPFVGPEQTTYELKQMVLDYYTRVMSFLENTKMKITPMLWISQ